MSDNHIFMDEISRSFQDSIKNIVYGLERYSNEFMSHVRKSFECSMYDLNDDIIGFLVCESEEIMRNRVLRSSIDICKMVTEKYSAVISRIEKQDDSISYVIYDDLFEYLHMTYTKFLSTNSNFIKYHKNDRYVAHDKIYDFTTFFEKASRRYSKVSFKKRQLILTKQDVMSYLENINAEFYNAMLAMKILIESCSSCYMATHVIRDMIECMIVVGICLASIEVTRQ